MSNTQRIQELTDKINKHRDLYYNKQSKISDEAFDAMCSELKKLDPNNSALTNIGAPLSVSEWTKDKHQTLMGSLNKVNTPDELKTWINEYFKKDNSIFYSEKIDGISVELQYVDGKLTKALTRGGGDGIGENILLNVRRMNGVKEYLSEPFTGAIRGEIIVRKSKFKEYFADTYANERNAASGISRRYDGIGCQHLDVLVYQAVGNEKLTSEYFQLQFLKLLGLQTPGFGSFSRDDNNHKANDIIRVWNEYQNGKREKLDYHIDGLVVRINDLATQEALGAKHKRPVGARAFKFEKESAVSTVKEIVCQVGGQGHITPVAEIEPVELMGVEISRATLHNFSNIKEIDINVGATVVISRRGDVIPYVEEVIEGTGESFSPPTKCPVCNGEVDWQGEFLICQNTDSCPAQCEGRLRNWIRGLDIKEFGGKLIEQLVSNGLVEDVWGLYQLDNDDVASLERMGEKSAKTCIDNLWANNSITLDTFVGSLSIPLVGKLTIQMLMDAGFDTMEKLQAASKEELQAVKGMGDKRAASLYNGLRKNSDLIERIRDCIVIKDHMKKTIDGKLKGMKICITGATNIKRADLAKMIIDSGGEFDKSVSKNTTHLCVAKSDSMTIKAQSARDKGVKIISEEELLAMIN